MSRETYIEVLTKKRIKQLKDIQYRPLRLLVTINLLGYAEFPHQLP